MPHTRALISSVVFVAAVLAVALATGMPQEVVKAGRKAAQQEPGRAFSPFHGARDARFEPPQSSAPHANVFLPEVAQSAAIFRVPALYGSGGGMASSVAVADLNGDGKPDLVVANVCNSSDCASGAVSVLLGNGDGSFQAAVNYGSGGAFAYSVAVADVNGDGKPDIVVANNCANSSNCPNGSVGVLLGNGDGTFQAAVACNSGGLYAYSVAVGDVNGDGKPDLLLANETGSSSADATVGVLLGNGDGTFKAAVAYDTGGLYAYSVAVGDVNGDGKPDLLIANQCASSSNCASGGVSVLLGKGDGTFRAAVAYGSGGINASFVAVTDLNHDGKPDLIVANQCATSNNCTLANGTVGVLLGNGDGTFQGAIAYDAGAYGSNSVAVGDVNGDGNLDLIVANQCEGEGDYGNTSCANGSVAVMLGNGNGTFQPAATYASGGYAALSLALGDVNGDGKPDLVVTNSSVSGSNNGNGTVAVLLGNGNGTFQAAAIYGPGGFQAEALATGDVNGDGTADLVIANRCASSSNCESGGVSVLLGNGDGTFRAPGVYTSGGNTAYSLAVADLNGDGKLDLVVANNCISSSNCANGTVGVLLGNGNGTFQPAVSYASGGYYAISVAVADVNGDGKPDLVVANNCVTSSNCANGRVSVLLGNGDGTFQPAVGYGSGGMFAFSVAVGDVNSDGKPDLLVANEYVSSGNLSNGTVGVLLGNGDGTFRAAVAYASGGKYGDSMAVGDVNGDGKLDLLVANQCASSSCTNGTLSVLLGNGDGTFQPAMITATPQIGNGALALADFDGDGKLDVASGAGDFLLLGNGDGTFQAPLLLGAGGPGIAVGDFNRDGKPDLAVGGVAILLNITAAKTATTTELVSSRNPSAYGQSVRFTATVTPQGAGTPTGTVTFTDGTATLGTVSLTSGSAALSTSALLTGTHNITVSYSGDSNFVPSASSPLKQTVNHATTATALTSSANPSYLNQTVTFTATVTSQYGGALTGSVTFKQGSSTVGTVSLSNGQALYATTYTNTGTRSITAVYSGDGNNQGSTSGVLKQVVNSLPAATTMALVTSGTPSFINQPVTFTATVTSTYGPIPDGELVTLNDGSTTLASVPLAGGVATHTTSSLKAGNHTIKATYAGDPTFKSSTKSITQVVNLYPSSTSVSSSLNPSTYGQGVTLTAKVTATAPGAPTGTVAFKNGTTSLGTATLNTSGLATLTKTNIPAGTDSITAVYNGDAETAKSTSAALVQTVNPAMTSTTITSSLNPSKVGQTVTFTAKVTSPTTVPTGTVTFMDGTTGLATVNLAGAKASYSTTTLGAGSHSITAVYNGTSNILGSTSPILVQIVN